MVISYSVDSRQLKKVYIRQNVFPCSSAFSLIPLESNQHRYWNEEECYILMPKII